jgi:hypothetical protein
MIKRVGDRDGALVVAWLSVALARDAAGCPQHFVVAIQDAADPGAAGAAATPGPAVDEAVPPEPDHARAIASALPEGTP